MASTETVLIIYNVNARRAAVRSSAWLDVLIDHQSCALNPNVLAAAPRTLLFVPLSRGRRIAYRANIHWLATIKLGWLRPMLFVIPRNVNDVVLVDAEGDNLASEHQVALDVRPLKPAVPAHESLLCSSIAGYSTEQRYEKDSDAHTSNEKELSHRWRRRASLSLQPS